jgi:hypothetical protein
MFAIVRTSELKPLAVLSVVSEETSTLQTRLELRRSRVYGIEEWIDGISLGTYDVRIA